MACTLIEQNPPDVAVLDIKPLPTGQPVAHGPTTCRGIPSHRRSNRW
jgi:hypothetical protein